MSDELDALVRDLLEDPAYARGKPHPRRTTPAEAGAILDDLYATHAEAAHKLPVIAEQMGHTIACKAGCAECCRELIAVTHAEAERVAAWLRQPAQAALKQRIVRRCHAWVAANGARADEALALMRKGDDAGYRALRHEHALAHVMCPVNEAGSCTVYPARPLICRLPYVVDTAEHCAAKDPPGPPAQLISSASYERLSLAAKQLVSGLEGTLGHDPKARLPLPVALLAALGE